MNNEGYRDPTAERAVANVSRQEKRIAEITQRQLIDVCWATAGKTSCTACPYRKPCDVFIRKTGRVPISCEMGDPEYTNEQVMRGGR